GAQEDRRPAPRHRGGARHQGAQARRQERRRARHRHRFGERTYRRRPVTHRFWALGVFVVVFVVYVAGLAPDVYWLDSSELAAAAFALGIAHPPGHPLPSLLGRACTLLPFGSIALRVGLASALAGAAAAAQTARLGALVARRARLPAQSDAHIDDALGAA